MVSPPKSDVSGADAWGIHGAGASSELYKLYKAGCLCDVVVVDDSGKEWPAHRIVLCAASHFFRSLYVGSGPNFKEGRDTKRVFLRGVDSVGLGLVLDHIYGAPSPAISGHSLLPLLDAAAFLGVDDAVALCVQLISSSITLSNVVDVLAISLRYTLPDLLSLAVRVCVLARVILWCASPRHALCLPVLCTSHQCKPTRPSPPGPAGGLPPHALQQSV
jgi:hypothetical protein